mgnify:FL=1
MPTPRPFNVPTTFAESPLGEINRQVQRMQQAASNPATRQGLSAFTQRILGIGKNALATGKAGLTTAGTLGGQALMGIGLPTVALVSAGTAPMYGGMTELTGKKNTIKKPMPGQLPSDYRRTELLASGQIPGGLPSDLKETEEAAGLSAERYRAGAGFPEQQFRDTSAPDGGDSKGTQTSPSPLKMKDVNKYLSGLGIKGFTPNQEFNSNQLPTTNSSPYGSLSEDAQVMGMSKEDADLIQSGGKVETVFKDGIESSGQIFKDPGSRAFLDYEGSGVGAFRAAERARGMITLQGKTYIPNPLAGQDGQEEFQLISQDQRNDVNSGRITAQDLASSYINRINGANADFSAQDYQTMGGNAANVPTMSNAGSVEVDIDADFDYENPTEVRRGMVF